MQFLFDPYRAALAFAAAVQFILFLRWLYRRIRNDELLRVFVEDMALNHLPHIYERLNQLCDQRGITHLDPPPIRWINLNGPRN
jgi:hypothetical protein